MMSWLIVSDDIILLFVGRIDQIASLGDGGTKVEALLSYVTPVK